MKKTGKFDRIVQTIPCPTAVGFKAKTVVHDEVQVVASVHKTIDGSFGYSLTKEGWEDFNYFCRLNGYSTVLSEDEMRDVIIEWEDYKYDMANKKKEENAMTETEKQRNHLLFRVSDIHYVKAAELEKAFNLNPDKPYTDLQKVEWTEKKWYRIEEQTDSWNSSKRKVLFWEKPDNKPDRTGYEAAYAAMSKAIEDLRDDIQILPVAEGLAALRAFEAKKFH